MVEQARAFQPKSLKEPYLKVSLHTALVIQHKKSLMHNYQLFFFQPKSGSERIAPLSHLKRLANVSHLVLSSKYLLNDIPWDLQTLNNLSQSRRDKLSVTYLHLVHASLPHGQIVFRPNS